MGSCRSRRRRPRRARTRSGSTRTIPCLRWVGPPFRRSPACRAGTPAPTTSARYRESLAEPRPLVPDQVTEFRIAVGPTANAFLTGHRIRLEVSSSNFPRFDPNTNTGGDTALEGPDALRLATNRVFHERAW